MVRKKYTEEQIITVLKESEVGAKTAKLCREYGASDGAGNGMSRRAAKVEGSDIVSIARRQRRSPQANDSTRLAFLRFGDVIASISVASLHLDQDSPHGKNERSETPLPLQKTPRRESVRLIKERRGLGKMGFPSQRG
jgi:hypothetical protein